ncbi:MAG: hypothetical protein WC919_07300 [Candidatus Paceibacterota bacterium]|jgi:hypothetical protein
MSEIYGTGLFDVRLGIKPAARKLIGLIGRIPVVECFVVRAPVGRMVQRIINLISTHGHHDTFYHLGIVCRLSNGELWLLEKNEEINLSRYRAHPLTETRKCPKPRADMNLGLIISNTIARYGWERVAHYRATSFNCQQFIVDVLQANFMLTDDLRAWIMQDVSTLLPAWAQALTNAVTDLKAHMDLIVEGQGSIASGSGTYYQTY